MKKILIIIFSLILLIFSGCDKEHTAYFRYYNQNGSLSKTIDIKQGYVLNDGHSYDIVETDNGYDIILHFIKYDSNN